MDFLKGAKVLPAPTTESVRVGSDVSTLLEHAQQPNAGNVNGGIPRKVHLRTALLDTYEYHGLRYLFLRVVYWALVIGAFFSSYSREQIVNSATMVDNVASFGAADYEQSHFRHQTSLRDGLAYMMALGNSLLSDAAAAAATTAINATNNSTIRSVPTAALLGEYSRLQYMRLVVDLDANCWHANLPCAAADGVAPQSALWERMSNGPSLMYDSPDLYSVLLYSQNDDYDAVAAQQRLADIAVDQPFIAKYAHLISFEVVCDHTLHPGKLKWVTLTVRCDLTLQAVQQYIYTVDLNADQLLSVMTLLLMSVVLIYTIVYGSVLVRSCWLYDLQRMRRWRAAGAAASGQPGQEPPRKASRLWSLTTFFTYSLWNVLEFVALLLCFLWCLSYFVLAVLSGRGVVPLRGGPMSAVTGESQSQHHSQYMDSALRDQARLNDVLLWGCLVAAWYQVGSFAILLTGLTVYPYFRVHSGLRLYLRVLSAVWRAILDFLCYFAFIFLLIGFFCLATTQLPGVQPDMTYLSGTFDALAKLMLGFYGFNEFVNKDVPKTSIMNNLQSGAFWISIILLFILVQNILLAIVAVAYDEARLSVNVTASLPFVILIQLTWIPIHLYFRLLRRLPPTRVAAALHTWPNSTFTEHYRRWVVAATAEAQTLQAYFTFCLNLHFKPRSPWIYNPLASQNSDAALAAPKRSGAAGNNPTAEIAARMWLGRRGVSDGHSGGGVGPGAPSSRIFADAADGNQPGVNTNDMSPAALATPAAAAPPPPIPLPPPPDDLTDPPFLLVNSKEELAAALQSLSNTPSFQRMTAITLPWPLHRWRSFPWQGNSSCEVLAELLWRSYGQYAVLAEGLIPAGEGVIGLSRERGSGGNGGRGEHPGQVAGEEEAVQRGRWMGRSAVAAAQAWKREDGNDDGGGDGARVAGVHNGVCNRVGYVGGSGGGGSGLPAADGGASACGVQRSTASLP